MKKIVQCFLSYVLIFAMTLQLLPAAFATQIVETEDGLAIVEQDGTTTKVDESWETRFPYGTFAFQNSQLSIQEGGESGVIEVYRLGGTTGSAMLVLTYVPAVAQMGEDQYSYCNAAGRDDITIEVEDALPIAAYQPIGQDPAPLAPETPISVFTAEGEGEGDIVLSVSTAAEAYQWYIYTGGSWEQVKGAEDQDFLLTQSELDVYDFRCVVTVDGIAYGSDSAWGETYVASEAAPLPEIPDDLPLNPEKTFSTLEMDSNDPYSAYAFNLVFADGEYKKEIRVTAPDNDVSNADRFGVFTITDCLGGELYDTANTMSLHVTDDDPVDESELGFTVSKITADKGDGSVFLEVTRTGGLERMISVSYETRDGSAAAGIDFSATAGELVFYGDVDTQIIEVPLIYAEHAEKAELSFSVVLTEVKGDADAEVTLTQDTIQVILTNEKTPEDMNLATLIHDAEAIDASSSVQIEGSSIAPVDLPEVTGQQQEEPEVVYATIGDSASGEIGPLSYHYPNAISFGRNVGPWKAEESLMNSSYFGTWSSANDSEIGAYNGTSGWKIETVEKKDSYIIVDDLATLYSGFSGYFTWRAKLASAWKLTWRGMEFTYPAFDMLKEIDTPYGISYDIYASANPNVKSWKDGTTYHISWLPNTYENFSWSMNSRVAAFVLSTRWHDAWPAEENALAAMNWGNLSRRYFNQDFRLTVHTANDADNAGDGNIKTAPANAAALDINVQDANKKNIYDHMYPDISITTGGTNASGKLFVGSTLKVQLTSTSSYVPMIVPNTNYAVYLTNSSNQIVATGESAGNDAYTIKMQWSGMSETTLNDTYTLHIIMNRVQKIQLNIEPSVPRQVVDGIPTSAIDTAQIGAAWSAFWEGNSQITYGYSAKKQAIPHFDTTTTDGSFNSSAYPGSQQSATAVSQSVENLQWINFNRPEGDIIRFNGRSYPGNARIYLTLEELSMPTLVFDYIAEEYLTIPSNLSARIVDTAVYLDLDGNGRIDGYYDQILGRFVIDSQSDDQFLFYLKDETDYDESIFTPVKLENGSYAQYFLKVRYSLSPRSEVPPEDVDSATAFAQVLPGLTTNVTNPATLALMTTQQKTYRYLESGKNRNTSDGSYLYSSDNRPMYGAAASKVTYLDIPLGGDYSPPALNSEKTGFDWTPNYHGNLLYPFVNPEPVHIAESLAGQNISVAPYSSIENVDGMVYRYGDNSEYLTRINGYLGSLAGNDTFVLAAQEQKKTTEEIKTANVISISSGVPSLPAESAATQPAPETITMGGTSVFPNNDHLKVSTGASQGNGDGIDMDGAGSSYPEFNQDMGIKLPTLEIGVTDYVTITMDGYEVGISVGIPVGGYSSNGDAAAGNDAGGGGTGSGQGQESNSDSKSNWYGPGAANKSNAEDIGKIRDFMRNPGKDTALASDDSLSNALGDDAQFSSKSFKVGFSVSLAVMFKYNPIDNRYVFEQFAASISAELEFTYQYRFTPLPIVYVYVNVGLELTVATGVTVDRIEVLDNTSLRSDVTLKKGEYLEIPITYKAIQTDFNGKLLLEVYKKVGSGGSELAVECNKGFIASEGSEPVTSVLANTKTMMLPDLGTTTYTLRVLALEDTTINSIYAVTRLESKSHWNGASLSIEAFIEAGIGVGIEIAKIEAYIKVNIGVAMTFGAYDAKTESYDPFSFDSFEFGLGLGVRAVFLFFTFEMDLIAYSIQYDGDTDQWTHSWSALGGAYGGEIGTLSVTDADGNTTEERVRILLPASTSSRQTIYAPQSDKGGEIAPMAYETTSAPFQISGYGSAGDAFKLADGFVTGYDYQVLTVGDMNYLVYTISRETSVSPLDQTQLVLSRLKLTSPSGEDSYGLVHPVTGADGDYLVIDNDDTGDLGFHAWVEGNNIHAAWVSYATTSAAGTGAVPEMPSAALFPVPTYEGSGTVTMDATNFDDVKFKVTFPTVVNEPTEVTDPGEFTGVEPVVTDYYLTPTEYADLDPTEQADYKPDNETTPTSYYHKDYANLTAAQTAYSTDKGTYDSAKSEHEAKASAYQTYLTDLGKYQTYQTEYQKAVKDQESYDLWFAYFSYQADPQQTLSAAAKNTVVKTASFAVKDTYTGSETFTTPVSAPAAAGQSYLPKSSGAGDTVFYASAVHYSTAELNTKCDEYNAYLLAAYPNDLNNANDATAQIRDYRAAYQRGYWNLYGNQTVLHVVENGTELGAGLALPAGQIIENMDVTMFGDVYYLSYTTGEQAYTAGNKDLMTIRRLYLRTATIESDNVTWGDPVLLRILVDYDSNTGEDGIYSNASATPGTNATTKYSDPYFSNISFHYAKLGEVVGVEEEFITTLAEIQPEHFLLFEMNGSTYVIPQTDLLGITSTTHKGRIIPFFTPEIHQNSDGTSATPTSTGRVEVTIGADGAGNLSAIYVSSVAGTSNNGLFLSKYDENTTTWGAGILLAMNHMQVYEDSEKMGWTAEELEKAYFGKRSDTTGGGMDQFIFSNLSVARGQTSKDPETGGFSTLSSDDNQVQTQSVTIPEIAPLADGDGGEEVKASESTKDTLLIITQGNMTYLKEQTADGKTYVVPMDREETEAEYQNRTEKEKYGVGVYAVSYGIGGQRIGGDSLRFVTYDFSNGFILRPTMSFTNTGDVSIRGSEANPIQVSLWYATEGGEQAQLGSSWLIKEPVRSGQRITLSGKVTLPKTLPAGTWLYIKVEENDYYANQGGTPFIASTYRTNDQGELVGTFLVEEKPELSFETQNITVNRVDNAGNAVLDVNLLVGNRGNTDADGVYLQFSYEDGIDNDGQPIYKALNITGHTLTTGGETKIETLSEISPLNAQGGIYQLDGPGANPDGIQATWQRAVTGTITVPSAYYQGNASGSLNLRIEICSNKTTGIQGDFKHDEYNTANNYADIHLEPTSFFLTADRIILAMGNTLRLPVTVQTAGSTTRPVITVEEMPGGNMPEENLGTLYYEEQGTYANGTSQGTVVIVPSKVGSGTIHLNDTTTNTLFPITYTVTEAGSGINIFKDNGLFTFYNANGSETDPELALAYRDWDFRSSIPSWGSSTAQSCTPMNADLSIAAAAGASFSFPTQAETINFSLKGRFEISSDFPGFGTKIVDTLGGTEVTTIKFGANAMYQSHTVTVKALAVDAQVDKMVELFSSGKPPVPSEDSKAPHIYWSRSFPQTGSLTLGTDTISLTCYILDDTMLNQIEVNGEVPSNLVKVEDQFYTFTVDFSENTMMSVSASDTSGNRTARTYRIDWFAQTPSGGAIGTAPDISAAFYKGSNLLGDTDYIGKNESASLAVTTSATTKEVNRIVSTIVDGVSNGLASSPVTVGDDGKYPVVSNGYYEALATADDGTWSRVILPMQRMDQSAPQVSMTLNSSSIQPLGSTASIQWTVIKGKDSVSPIQTASINGTTLNSNHGFLAGKTSVAGQFPIAYGGSYVLYAKDAAGNEATDSVIFDSLPVITNQNLVQVAHSYNQEQDNGIITIYPAGVTSGGSYLSALSDAEKAAGNYVGSYECFLPTGDERFQFEVEPFVFDEETVKTELLEEYALAHPDDPGTGDVDESVMPEEELLTALEQKRQAAYQLWETQQSKAEQDAFILWEEAMLAASYDSQWKPLTGTVTYENLAPGTYHLLVRDAQNSATYQSGAAKRSINIAALTTITVEDQAIVMQVATEDTTKDDGAATATVVSGGYLNPPAFQFAIRPLEEPTPIEGTEDFDYHTVSLKEMTDPLDADLFPEQEAPVWQMPNIAAHQGGEHRFEELTPGWYQVAVRPTVGITAAEMNDLYAAYDAIVLTDSLLTEAQARQTEQGIQAAMYQYIGRINDALNQATDPVQDPTYLALIDNDPAIISLLEAWLAVKPDTPPADDEPMVPEEAAYQSALLVLAREKAEVSIQAEIDALTAQREQKQQAYDAMYQTLDQKAQLDENSPYWSNGTYEVVEIKRIATGGGGKGKNEITDKDLIYLDDGTILIVFEKGQETIAPKTKETLAEESPTHDILAKSPSMTVLVPKGTLSKGDDIANLLMPTVVPPTEAGNVVIYTTPDGVEHPVPWSYLTPGRVYYIASAVGVYFIKEHTVSFPDLDEDHWGYQGLYYAAANGLLQGDDKGMLLPDASMTRAMFVTMLGRLAGISPELTGEITFVDVPADAWYAPYLIWAAEQGIVKGNELNEFMPDTEVSREQLCAMLARYLESSGIKIPKTGTQVTFDDDNLIATWAREEVTYLVERGLMQGIGGNLFAPQRTMTRAEAATLFERTVRSYLTSK